MSRLLETIHIKNGNICNLSFHNQRLNRSRRELLLQKDEIDLRDFIHVSSSLTQSNIKCRVLYESHIELIEYHHYVPKAIRSLKLIHNDQITYNYKFENRNDLTALYEQKGSFDDILIVRDGLLTDSYYCNIALLKEGIWVTPQTPLLQGTTRAALLEKGILKEANIHVDSIQEFESIRLFNSMLSFGQIELPISSVG